MDANGIVNFIEVNPLAGLNYITSDLPIMCNLKGKSFNSLIKDIIMSAQKRIGKNGKINYIYKYRTMIPEADKVLKELLKKPKYKKSRKVMKRSK